MADPNPFRVRHSEAVGVDSTFARTFAPQVFSVLPARPWTDNLLILRSAPGAGKTSLMLSLEAETLAYVHRHRNRHTTLAAAYSELGVMDDTGPKLLGLRVRIDRDFRSLADIGDDPDVQAGLVFRLLDARLVASLVRGSLALASPRRGEASRVRVVAEPGDDNAVRALQRLGGGTGEGLMDTAEESENTVLDLLDRLVRRDGSRTHGHTRPYFLDALAGARVLVDETEVVADVHVMVDDAHHLPPALLSRLLAVFAERRLRMSRWVAVQSKALTDGELMGAGAPGRDYDVVEMEALARPRAPSAEAATKLSGQTMTESRYRRMLYDIANSRARTAIGRLVDDERDFESFVDDDPESALDGHEDALDTARDRLRDKAGTNVRYREWLADIDALDGYAGLARIAELRVLVERDLRQAQGDLFDDVLPLPQENAAAASSSSLREAALLAATHDSHVPYYWGNRAFARLASANVEQFLDLCGDFMSALQLQAASNRSVALPPRTQDKLIRDASHKYYRELAQLPDGALVQRLVDGVAEIAEVEARKPTIPYPPGVTGTALTMTDRERLGKAAYRETVPGAEHLWRALVSAVAHNVVWLENDYRSKNQRVMVIYLNRLLCPRFTMPLQLGGFRERPLTRMAAWFTDDGFVQEGLL